MARQQASMVKQIPVFGMLAILFVMIFSFPANEIEKQAKQESTFISVTAVNAATHSLQAEAYPEVVLTLPHVIFDFVTVTKDDSRHKKSESIFLAVNTFVRNPFYAVPTTHAP